LTFEFELLLFVSYRTVNLT